MTYIHYGSDHFDLALFVPVRNGGLEYGFRPKPAGRYGAVSKQRGRSERLGSLVPGSKV